MGLFLEIHRAKGPRVADATWATNLALHSCLFKYLAYKEPGEMVPRKIKMPLIHIKKAQPHL